MVFNQGDQIAVTLTGKEQGVTLGLGSVPFTCTLTDGTKNFDTEMVGPTSTIATFDFSTNTLDVANGTNVNLQVVCNLSDFTQIGDYFSASLASAPSAIEWYDGYTNVTTDGALIFPVNLVSLATFTNN